MKIEVTPLRAGVCDGAADTLHVMVEVSCGAVPERAEGQSNLALVIDRSGSMGGGKLEAAKRSISELVQRLGQSDAVGVVAYDDEVETTLGLSKVPVARSVLPALLQRMTTGGSTDLHGGWLAGASMLAPDAGGRVACHVILLSDGQANQGVTSTHRICEQVNNLCDAGITTTTIGFGRDFNEELMTAMAKAGNGRAIYGERIEDLADAFDEEISLLGNLVWRDVVLSFDLPRRPEVMNGYPRHEAGWRLPALARGGSAWVMLALPMHQTFRMAERNEPLRVSVSGVDHEGQRHTFELAWALPPLVSADAWRDLPQDERVARRLQELELARLQNEIRRLVMRGRWEEAKEMFEALRERAATDAWLAESLPFLERLLAERDEMRMSKELAFRSVALSQRLRASDGTEFLGCLQDIQPRFLRRKSTDERGRG